MPHCTILMQTAKTGMTAVTLVLNKRKEMRLRTIDLNQDNHIDHITLLLPHYANLWLTAKTKMTVMIR